MEDADSRGPGEGEAEAKKIQILFDSQASFVPESPPLSQPPSETQLELLNKLQETTESESSLKCDSQSEVNVGNVDTPSFSMPPNPKASAILRDRLAAVDSYEIVDDSPPRLRPDDKGSELDMDDLVVEEELNTEDEDEIIIEEDEEIVEESISSISRPSVDCVIDMDVDEVGDNVIREVALEEPPENLTVAGHPSLDAFFDDDTHFLEDVEKLEQESLLEDKESAKECNGAGEGEGDNNGFIVHRSEHHRLEEVTRMKRLDPKERIFPDVKPSSFHTVTFFLDPDYKPGHELRPHPPTYESKWDNEFVPLPCAKQNTRLFKIRVQSDNQNGDDRVRYREERFWMWSRIEGALNFQILTCSDIAQVLKQYCPVKTELKALNYCIESLMSDIERCNFFSRVLPRMQTLCMDLERLVTCPLPLLKKFKNQSISLSQKQIAALLANAFFSTFPKRFGDDEEQYPSINFVELFQCTDEDDDNSRLVTKAQKIRCILNYFERVEDYMPNGVVTFTRKSIRHAAAPNWDSLTKKISKIVPLLYGTIEDEGSGMLQVDFANKFLGGGVLGRGAVQEEILFAIYPELIVSRLFTEKLTSCEALIVTGCERFSRYSGYAATFRYDGDFIDVTSFDRKGRRCTQFVAIDALYITRPLTQFHPRFLTRELNKAYVGFSSPIASSVPVATGKWGCGAFNGNPQLKAILQLLAASQAGRDVVFFTFGDLAIQKEIEEMYETIKNCSIQQVYQLLCHYYTLFCTTPKPKYTLYEYIARFANGEEDSGGSANSLLESTSAFSSWTKDTAGGNSLLGGSKLKEVPITSFYTKDNDFQKSVPMDEDANFPSTSSDHVLNNPSSELNLTSKPKISKTPFLKTATTPKSAVKKNFSQTEILTDNQIIDLLLTDENSQENPDLVQDREVILLDKGGISNGARTSPAQARVSLQSPSNSSNSPGFTFRSKERSVGKQTSLTDFDFYKK